MRSDVRRGVSGALSGLAATWPMTAVLVSASRRGLLDELPPLKIVHHLLPGLDERSTRALAAVAHAAYGAGAGAVLGALAPAAPLKHRATIGYGLLVWFLSYQGWVPLAGVMPPVVRDRRGRALSIALAHVVWGAALRIPAR
jgi:hypothetical protein